MQVLHHVILQPAYRVDKRKSQTEALLGSLNWLISRSLSEAEVLPSSPEKEIKDAFKSAAFGGIPAEQTCFPTTQLWLWFLLNSMHSCTPGPQLDHSVPLICPAR